MISMHASQPGTRRRTCAKQVGGKAHSTVVEYEGESSDVTDAIRRAEQPSSNNMALFAKPRAQFGMVGGARNRQHAKLRDVEPSEEREEKATTLSVEVGEETRFERRRNGVQRGEQDWTQRGVFKLGFNAGSPRVRGARKFTK